MPNIYAVDTDVKVIATNVEKAAIAYTLDRALEATSITKETDTANVIVADEAFAFTAIVDPAPAIGDALVYPVAGSVKSTSDQVFTAIPGAIYSTFVEWRDASDVLITTDNPATINIDEEGKVIKAFFSV